LKEKKLSDLHQLLQYDDDDDDDVLD